VVLEFVRRDALALLVPALPVPAWRDLRALPVGRREDGLPWRVRLRGTHVLVPGATGAGKASLLWGLVRAMFPLMQDGLVRVLAADPELMELAYGRIIFDTYGSYAATPANIAAMLETAVADMQDRAARCAGLQRDHTPTVEDPFTVVLVDEVAFLTAYQPDRKLKERIMLALATLTTQGRALGYAVVAALALALARRPSPHRTDCCRPIRRRGCQGPIRASVNQALSPVLVALRPHRPLMPDWRGITIRWQSGGGSLQLPWSSGTRWISSDRCWFPRLTAPNLALSTWESDRWRISNRPRSCVAHPRAASSRCP
jgi:hypothetical protein